MTGPLPNLLDRSRGAVPGSISQISARPVDDMNLDSNEGYITLLMTEKF